MNDLYIVPEARGRGVGRQLIEHCRGLCRKRGAGKLVWETAPDNKTAQRLYDSTGADVVDLARPTRSTPGRDSSGTAQLCVLVGLRPKASRLTAS